MLGNPITWANLIGLLKVYRRKKKKIFIQFMVSSIQLRLTFKIQNFIYYNNDNSNLVPLGESNI